MTTINPPAGNASAVQTLRDAVRSNEEVYLARGTWIIDDQIDMAGICGKITADAEAVIRLPQNTKREGFLIRNLSKPLEFEPKKVISETTFKGQEAPFYIINQGDVTIRGADISGIQYGHAISVRNTKDGNECKFVTIANCKIQARQVDERVNADERTTAIAVNGTLEFEPGYSSPNRQYVGIHKPPRVVKPISYPIITGNDITGGYYAIELSGVHGGHITYNWMKLNTRGLSMQNSSVSNQVRYNNVIDNISAAIHCAYGATGNIIEFNNIESSRAEGEGLLQAYVGSTGNIFRGNRVSCNIEGDTRPKYMLYCAVDSGSNVFEANYLNGSAKNALIGVESDWSNSINLVYHRSYRASNDDNNMAGDHMRAVSICRNVFRDGTPGRAILLSSVNGKKLSDIYCYGNVIPSGLTNDFIGKENISEVFNVQGF